MNHESHFRIYKFLVTLVLGFLSLGTKTEASSLRFLSLGDDVVLWKAFSQALGFGGLMVIPSALFWDDNPK